MNVLNHFHFIRPEFLWALPVILIIWLLLKRVSTSSEWHAHLPKAVVAALQITPSTSANTSKWLWLIAWSLMCVATSGPSWQKQEVPVVQNQNATVIVLDLSQSMLAKDLTPNRLTLAKYKLIDVLRLSDKNNEERPGNASTDGQFALITYSGDAYTVSPLTDDPKTIEALLPALHPNIMPSIGSNVEAAMLQATELLSASGIASGHILLITDGIAPAAFDTIERTLSGKHQLSILGAASNEAAPVPLSNGGFLRKTNGEILLASINTPELQNLASSLGGKFAQLNSSDRDLQFLLNTKFTASEQSEQLNDTRFDAWSDMGHYLIILMLPLFLVFFRKGLVYGLAIISTGLLVSPSDSYAASLWDRAWKNSDQIGRKLLESENFEAATETFKSKDWSAVAAYKNGDYAKTIEQLAGKTDANSLYNKANALALNGDFDEAINQYKKVLEIDSNNSDAKHNLDVLEQLKQQQEQQKQQGQNQEDQQNSESSEQQNSEQSQSQESKESNEQNAEQQSQQAQQDDQQETEEQGEAQAENKDPKEEQQQAANEESNEGEESSDDNTQTVQQASPSTSDSLKDSSEQWLRSIDDDPSGLLRRKFEYQAQQRQRQGKRSRLQKDESGQQRY